MPKKLTQYGCPTAYGCPACGFRRSDWSKVKTHMYQCCPEYFDEYTTGDLRNGYCNLSAGRCIVPGHEEWREEKRRECQERKARKQRKKNAKRNMPRWDKHDDKLNGGIYDRSATNTSSLSEEVDEGAIRALLETEFDQYPDGPYGVQEAMGSREDWIHWGLQLSAYPSQTAIVMDEYQKDIELHIDGLNMLSHEDLEEGYAGSFTYIQSLHCIFHDAFVRCKLPTPPLLDLEHAMRIRNDGVDAKSRMRSFRGYKFRAFGMVQVIQDNLVNGNGTIPNMHFAEESHQHQHQHQHQLVFEAKPPVLRCPLRRNENAPQSQRRHGFNHHHHNNPYGGGDFLSHMNYYRDSSSLSLSSSPHMNYDSTSYDYEDSSSRMNNYYSTYMNYYSTDG